MIVCSTLTVYPQHALHFFVIHQIWLIILTRLELDGLQHILRDLLTTYRMGPVFHLRGLVGTPTDEFTSTQVELTTVDLNVTAVELNPGHGTR